MKGLRFLLLGMAIWLASGMKAQFYDSADDIYYYVEEYYEYEESATRMGPFFSIETYKTGKTIRNKPEGENAWVLIFNFDGLKAALLSSGHYIPTIKSHLKASSSYYEDKVETTDYNWKYVSSSYAGTVYERPNSKETYTFSSDRNTLIESGYSPIGFESFKHTRQYKRVDKSFFKVGRSRTPSGTMHE